MNFEKQAASFMCGFALAIVLVAIINGDYGWATLAALAGVFLGYAATPDKED